MWDATTLCEETNGHITLTWTHQDLHPLTQTERIDHAEVDDRFFAIVTDLVGTPTHLLAEDGPTAGTPAAPIRRITVPIAQLLTSLLAGSIVITEFSVRPDQGDPSGFDLGDMMWRGELGEAGSAGHVPDQGMMIYVSVTELMDCLGRLLQGRTRSVSFTGADTSFGLAFRKTAKGIRVASSSRPVAVVRPAVLARTTLSAAEELARLHLDGLPPDGVADDYVAALKKFRLTVNAC
ncbi:hypothetical protein SUDANB120_01899 [Streptomyces sp. enrichment culture]|uniref:hypothetical protein n=1 Tax=Streptomyces sp. enrichment culture TaxID=1795815 RepID=UPI003F54D80B